MTERTRNRVDYNSEQYYTVPFGGAERSMSRAADAREPLFSVRAEIARLALNIEALVQEHDGLVHAVSELKEGTESAASGEKARVEDLSARLDSLRALLVTRLSGMVPALNDAIANLDEGVKAELSALARLVARSSEHRDAAPVSHPDIEVRLDRIEGALALKDRLEADGKERREFLDLINVVDSFDRLLSFLEDSQLEGKDSWWTGVHSIHTLIVDYLGKRGVRRIEEFDSFDPQIHRAMATVDLPDVDEGAVSRVLLSGYLHKGKVLRCAEVVVVRHRKQ